MAERVWLHVGTPKSGTSFVQDRLFANPQALAVQGVSYPADRHDAHFLAALDLMGLKWGGLQDEAVGHWDALAERVRATEGTVILSHEILGIATPEQVRRVRDSLGDAEVHVVVSARDLVRQVPAEWQENVKHRRRLTYAEFVERIQDPDRGTVLGWWFWGVQHVPEITARWGEGLPAHRVHLVTVPPPGSERDLLWHRFGEVFGIDVGDFRLETERVNPSLGVPQAAFVRRLNERINGVVANPDYRQFVRERLAHRTLSRIPSARLSVPPEVYDWAAGLSRAWVEELAGRGYHMVGDLADLLPVAPLPWSDPDAPDEAAVVDAGTASVEALIQEAVRLRDEGHALRGEIDRLHREEIAPREHEIQRLHDQPLYRVKHALVQRADTSRVAAGGLAAYRRVFRRGRTP